jgi:uncharacterized protein
LPYLPDAIPGPDPTIDDRAFWDYCRTGELRFQRCAECGRFRAPPTPVCPRCQSDCCEWIEASDEAELFSYTVVHFKAHPGIASALPYNVAIVRFPSFDNVRLVSNVVGIENADLHIGMPLVLVWEGSASAIPVPRFKPREAQP